MKYLVIAEKPSVARSISKVIGSQRNTADGRPLDGFRLRHWQC